MHREDVLEGWNSCWLIGRVICREEEAAEGLGDG